MLDIQQTNPKKWKVGSSMKTGQPRGTVVAFIVEAVAIAKMVQASISRLPKVDAVYGSVPLARKRTLRNTSNVVGWTVAEAAAV